MSGHHALAPEVYNGVSTLDEPSAAWGWHNIGRRAVQISGWISVIFLLCMLIGNHHGHIEDIYLVVIAVVIALGLILQLLLPGMHLKQRTTVTARNKAPGHKEPDWAYDQKHLKGVYAELNDSQLRSLNVDPAAAK
ncbi:MAG: DUF2631 domain-containing protein [Corynebacterium sp.]|nr:DUF2631 domain-containing protein [Corynebacterium sp.]